MTDTRDRILAFVQQFIAAHSYSPSFKEIQDGCGLSCSTVSLYLKNLRERGYITYEDGKSRTIVLWRHA